MARECVPCLASSFSLPPVAKVALGRVRPAVSRCSSRDGSVMTSFGGSSLERCERRGGFKLVKDAAVVEEGGTLLDQEDGRWGA